MYVHQAIAPEFIRRFIDATAKLKVGNPLDKDCDVGPMIDEAEAKRAEAWVKEAVAEGAQVLIGGKREGRVVLSHGPQQRSTGYEGHVHRGFRAARFHLRRMSISRMRCGCWRTPPTGSRPAFTPTTCARPSTPSININAGGIMINDTSIFRVDHMPYGGNKMSGLGREGVRFAIDEMTNIKMVVIKP